MEKASRGIHQKRNQNAIIRDVGSPPNIRGSKEFPKSMLVHGFKRVPEIHVSAWVQTVNKTGILQN